MLYKSRIETITSEASFEGGMNHMNLYALGDEQVLFITPKFPSLEKEHPYKRLSAPRLARLLPDQISWRNYRQHKEFTDKLLKAGISVAKILEVGEEYIVREFIQGETLRVKLGKGDTSAVRDWFKELVFAGLNNLIIGDNITANVIITPDNKPVLFDFELDYRSREFVIAQALFYSFWLSDNLGGMCDAVQETFEGDIARSGVYNTERINFFLFDGYLDEVIHPDKTTSIFGRIECHPNITTEALKREHRLRVKETLEKLLK